MHSIRMALPWQNVKIPFGFLVIATLLFTACNTSTSTLPMAPLDQMPSEVQKAPVSVQEAYRFAVANPEVLSQVPCYCGCGAIGHTSNYDCYVKDVQPSGEIEFDTHALGCSICVDITQDVMRLSREGKTLDHIQAFIDRTYSQYGPPTPLKP
jgi:hypothetical protein